jgi:flagellar M-ring protein FliF
MIDGSGNIKRITVAAVINGVVREVQNGETTELVNEPRTDEQLQQLELLLRQSVGIDDTRNDEISIVSIPFESNKYDIVEGMDGGPSMDNMGQYINYIILLLAIGGAVFVLKGLLTKLKEEKIMIGTVGGGSVYADQSFDSIANAPVWEPQISLQKNKRNKKPLFEMGDIEDEITDEAVMKKMKQDKITNYVGKNPSEAAKLINSWLKEDEYS